MALRVEVGLDVEAGQPQGGADHIQRRQHPEDLAGERRAELQQQKGRRDAEADDVAEAIEVAPELGGNFGQAGHSAVEHVEQHGGEDQPASGGQQLQDLIVAGVGGNLGGEGDGREAADPVAEGKEGRDDGDRLHGWSPPYRATIETPARTRWPTWVLMCSPDSIGRQSSVREPNLIIPNLRPRWSNSAGRASQTIRRAIAPAICLTNSRRCGGDSSWRSSHNCSFWAAERGRMAFRNLPGKY